MVESGACNADHLHVLPPGATISGYVIRRMLGRGGFGITYEAENPVIEKQFAIKEFFPSSMAWRDARARLVHSKSDAETIEWALRKFRETTTTLYGLSHPNIVKVHDYVPANDTGYMVMELLRGQTLKDWLENRTVPPSLAELRPHVDPVMEALAYVHGRGLIHRDIAPDNILLVHEGRPVLIDFGSVSRDLSDARQQAHDGTTGLIKRHYTAPEQARAMAWPTPEADVYSMAAVLYFALRGVVPADGKMRQDAVVLGRKADPYEPLAAHCPPGCPIRAAQAIDKALSMRPEDRYRSIAELYDTLREELPTPKPEKQDVGPATKVEATCGVRVPEATEPTLVEPTPTSEKRERPSLWTRRWVLGSIAGGVVATTAIVLPLEEQRRAAQAKAQALRTFAGHAKWVKSVAIMPDGLSLLSGSGDKTLKLWDLASGQELRTFTGHKDWALSVAIAPDGRSALSGSADNTLKLWDLAAGRVLRTFSGHMDSVNSVAIAPDGRTALSGSLDATLKLWDLASGRVLRTFNGLMHVVLSVTIAPDGRTALSGSADNALKLWDLASGRELRTFAGHSNWVNSVAFAPDKRTALSGSSDNTLKLWDLASGRELRTFAGHSNTVESVTIAPHGRTALSGSSDMTLKLWDLASGRELRTFIGHTGSATSVAIAPDGRTGLSGSKDKTLKLWDIASV